MPSDLLSTPELTGTSGPIGWLQFTEANPEETFSAPWIFTLQKDLDLGRNSI